MLRDLGSHYIRYAVPSGAIFILRGYLPAENHTKLLASPLSLIRNHRDITSSRHTRVYAGHFTTEYGRTIETYLKCFIDRDWTDGIKQLLRPHRAIRETIANHQLRSSGFTAPEVILLGYQKGFPAKKFFIVTKALLGFTDIYHVAKKIPALDHKQKKLLLTQLGTTIGCLHQAGFSHGDLRPGNILVNMTTPEPEIAFLDNERTRKHKTIPERLRIKNLVQLNMLISPNVSARDRLYCFVHYCRHGDIANPRALASHVISKTRQRLLKLAAQGRIDAKDIFL